MKTKIIAVAVCLTCLSTPTYTTGLLEAKIAAAAGVAKGAALLGAGALAAKGAVLKGVGSLMAAKGAAIKDVLTAAAKPVEVSIPSIVVEQPTMVSNPCIVSVPSVELKPPADNKPSKPTGVGSLVSAEVQTPVLSAGLEVLPKPVVSLLGDRLTGLLNTIDNTLSKPVLVSRVQSPAVYEIVRTPTFYPVPIY